METLTKICNVCGETKPLAAYYPRSPASTHGKDYAGSLSGVSAGCRVCVKARAADRRKRLGDDHVKYMKEFDLRKKYGITLARFNEMLAKQNNCCAICERHQTEFVKGLVVDHDHATGAIRKLLCTNCNVAIGMLGENIGLLVKAIDYLKTHAALSGISEPTASSKDAENGAEKSESFMH
jgi:Recombination endonuclease VII